MSLVVQPFCLGEWMTNCYVVHVDGGASGGCWVVDAGYQPGEMIRYVQERGLTPRRVILTHGHLDHIAGLHDLRAVWPEVPILIHPSETRFLVRPVLNLSALLAEPVKAPEATGALEHGDRLTLDGVTFEVRHTPGHSPGGVSLYEPTHGVVIVGDTLFAESVGRSDFPTSDGPALMESIRTQLMTLPDETRVLPGHGPATTIGHERAHNPFVGGGVVS